MKTEKELAELKEEVKKITEKLKELTEEELLQVCGGSRDDLPKPNPDEKYIME